MGVLDLIGYHAIFVGFVFVAGVIIGRMVPGGDCFGPRKEGPKRKNPMPPSPLERIAKRDAEIERLERLTPYLNVAGIEKAVEEKETAEAALAKAEEERDRLKCCANCDRDPAACDECDECGGFATHWIMDARLREQPTDPANADGKETP